MNKFRARLRGAVKSKLMYLHYLLMLLGVAETIIPETSIPWQYQGIILVGFGTLGMIFRWVTTKDLADK